MNNIAKDIVFIESTPDLISGIYSTFYKNETTVEQHLRKLCSQTAWSSTFFLRR